MRAANLVLRFVLELCALLAFAVWGWSLSSATPVRLTAAVLAPLSAATAWGLLASPKARYRPPDPWRLGVEVLFFGAATAALGVSGHVVAAVLFAAGTTLNLALLAAWRQR